MSDENAVTPRTSGSAAPGTEGGPDQDDTAGRPDHLPRRDDDRGGEMDRAAQDRRQADIDNPIEGEGTTEEGRRNAVETATGPKGDAAVGGAATRPHRHDEPDPGATGGA